MQQAWRCSHLEGGTQDAGAEAAERKHAQGEHVEADAVGEAAHAAAGLAYGAPAEGAAAQRSAACQEGNRHGSRSEGGTEPATHDRSSRSRPRALTPPVPLPSCRACAGGRRRRRAPHRPCLHRGAGVSATDQQHLMLAGVLHANRSARVGHTVLHQPQLTWRQRSILEAWVLVSQRRGAQRGVRGLPGEPGAECGGGQEQMHTVHSAVAVCAGLACPPGRTNNQPSSRPPRRRPAAAHSATTGAAGRAAWPPPLRGHPAPA